MSFVSVFLVTILMIVWVGWLWSRRRFYKLHTKLPGPAGLPFIGIGLKLMNTEKFLQTLGDAIKGYKTPCTTWLGTSCHLYVDDPETVETVFQSSCCTNKGEIYKFLSAAIGEGLFTADSPRWNEHRRLLNPAFGRKVIESFIPIFNRECNTLVNKLSTIGDQSLELYEVVKRSTLNVACQTTLGQNINIQDDDPCDLIDAYTSVLDAMIKRFLSPWLYSDAIYSLSSGYKLLHKSLDIINRFIENNLENVILGSGSSQEGCIPNECEFEVIPKSKSKTFVECVRGHIQNGNLSMQDVIAESHTVVAASFETISTTVYFVCLSLALNPEYQDKLYSELIDLFPNDEDVTTETLEQMTYTEMVINESMRLFAPVPIVLRSASADFHLRDGTLIPHGTQIVINIFSMHRSEHVWGPYAHSFDPERHFGSANQQHPFAFVPFTKGARMCIGYRYAMLHMKILIAKIFRNFRVHTDAKLCDLVPKGTISLKLAKYPLCKFERR